MYIYDRPSQDHYYSYGIANRSGLNAENGALHGSKEDECPEVMSPAAVVQLIEEIDTLARKNAYTGVDRKYRCLEQMGDEAFNLIPKGLASVTDIHLLGAQASNVLGETLLYQTRLLREKSRLWSLKMSLEGGSYENPEMIATMTSLGKIDQLLGEIETTYGSVRIAPRKKSPSKRQRAQLQLTPVVWPFAPTQRRSIEFADKTIKDTGSFTGLLPKGDYTLAGKSFTVSAGTDLKKRIDVVWSN
jgi:hypothetical protein